MARNNIALKIDGYGRTVAGSIDTDSLNWYNGWYVYIKDVTTGTTNNSFSIDYLTSNVLYDKFYDEFGLAIDGGCDIADLHTTETYACPTRASGAVLWSDVSPGYITYESGQLNPVNLVKPRKKNFQSYFYYDLDGYAQEMVLLFGFTESAGGLGGDAAHYMFWAYVDEDGNFNQVPNSSSYLPGTSEAFDILVPVSVNIRHSFWNSGLFQNSKSTQSSGGSIISGNFDIIKVNDIIATTGEGDGTDSFMDVDISNLAGSNNVILGFVNGLEVNVSIKMLALADAGDDVIIDVNSAGYPSVTNVYWNGTARATSGMGDLEVDDIVRLYIPLAS